MGEKRTIRVRTKDGYIHILLEDYETLFKAQNGVCAICHNPCKTKRRLAVDHDHATGQIRGLLCFNCNTHLGWVDEYGKEISKYLVQVPKNISQVGVMSLETWYRRGKTICKFTDCINIVKCHGWCQKHWYRVNLYGDPDKLLKPRK